MNNSDFVHLHLHTEYSLLDGACRIDKLFEHIKSLGQKAVAITDCNCMYGVLKFYKTAEKYGIKPIIGCEIEISENKNSDKLVLLCKNQEGYRNLIKIVSLLNSEGENILIKHNKGIICLSDVSKKLLNGDYNSAKQTAEIYRNIFKDGYYLEIQNHGLENEIKLIPQIFRLSAETGIPLVATNNCYYITKNDSEIRKILHCIKTNKSFYETDETELENREFYVKSTDEMYELFKNHQDVLLNTSKIAEECNFKFNFGNMKLPKFNGASNNTEFFINLCKEGMYKKYGENPPPEVTRRLEYETDTIIKMGYTDYYLIVWDFVKYAKNNNIPVGPGRGSGAGSLCAYCIDITDIDPIKFNLIFERFLNPERKNMPDFDIDFCIEGRHKVKDYVIEKYGREKVAEIISFDTLKARASVRDVGRIMRISNQLTDKTAKLIGNDINITLESALRNERELSELYNSNAQVKKLIDMSAEIEGFPRNTTTHAAGVVISPEPLDEIVPLQKNDDTILTQYTKSGLEDIGLLKIDFLGLRNLTVIRDTINQIRKTEPDFDISNIPNDDQKVYEMMSSGDLSGIFQFESRGIGNVVKKLMPKNLEDLSVILALYRPGPMEFIPRYIENRNNPEKIKYKHPMLEDILKSTYGCIIYQEQVMEICRKLADFSYGNADVLRDAMSKKKHDIMIKEKDNFIAGAVKNGISYEIAEDIFNEVEGFSSYAFNKSHAVAYAHLSYQTAYLKCHYFNEYMASLMSSLTQNNSKIIEYISLCRLHKTEIRKPDINISSSQFTASGNVIYFGLCAIKNVGMSMSEKIVSERQANGNYKTFQDFCERISGREISKKAVENLIKAGAFDNLDLNRRQLLENYEDIMDSSASDRSSVIKGQMNLFETEEISGFNIKPVPEYDIKTILKMEKDVSGLYLSGNLFDYYEYLKVYLKTMQIYEINNQKDEFKNGENIKLICVIKSVRPYTSKNGNKLYFLTIDDGTGELDAAAFSDTYKSFSNLVFIAGRLSFKSGKLSIFCDKILDIEKDINSLISDKKLCIKLNSDELQNFSEISRILNSHSGSNKLCIYLKDKKKMISPKKNISVSADEKLFKELIKIISPEDFALI